MTIRRRRPRDLSTLLADRIVREGDLVGMLTDAILAQDLRWVQDQLAGRRSVI